MCGLCGLLGSQAHWTDLRGAGVDRGGNGDDPGGAAAAEFARLRRRERQQRVAYLNPLLARFGCTVADWHGKSYLLKTFTGKSAIVADLSALWSAVARLTGRTPDPFSPLLAAASS